MKRYLFWMGGLMVAMVLLVALIAGLFPKHVACERFYEYYAYPMHAPEQTSTTVTPDWYILADCQGVQSNLYLAYYFIAIGAALAGVGFVVRR